MIILVVFILVAALWRLQHLVLVCLRTNVSQLLNFIKILEFKWRTNWRVIVITNWRVIGKL